LIWNYIQRSLLALWAVTRIRIGFYRHSVAFKNGIYTHLVYFNTRMPVRQLYLQLGRVVGVPSGQPELTGPIRIDNGERSAVRHILTGSPGWQPHEPYIVVNPNASDLLLERRWPAEYFIDTLRQFALHGYQVALIGNDVEFPYVQSLFERLPPDVQSRVTNDTGPIYMAVALQCPTVCLFGPAHPEHYGQDLVLPGQDGRVGPSWSES
jgi:ADP-heptose:LPS heptosyltransferase